MKNKLNKYKSCELFLTILIACASIDMFFGSQSFFYHSNLMQAFFLAKELSVVYLSLIVVELTTDFIFFIKDFICSLYQKLWK